MHRALSSLSNANSGSRLCALRQQDVDPVALFDLMLEFEEDWRWWAIGMLIVPVLGLSRVMRSIRECVNVVASARRSCEFETNEYSNLPSFDV